MENGIMFLLILVNATNKQPENILYINKPSFQIQPQCFITIIHLLYYFIFSEASGSFPKRWWSVSLEPLTSEETHGGPQDFGLSCRPPKLFHSRFDQCFSGF